MVNTLVTIQQSWIELCELGLLLASQTNDLDEWSHQIREKQCHHILISRIICVVFKVWNAVERSRPRKWGFFPNLIYLFYPHDLFDRNQKLKCRGTTSAVRVKFWVLFPGQGLCIALLFALVEYLYYDIKNIISQQQYSFT